MMRDGPSTAETVIFFFNGTFMRGANGAHARAAAFLAFLCRNAGRVTVYSFRNHPDYPWTQRDIVGFKQRFPDATLVLEERTAALIALTRLKNMLAAFAPAQTRGILRLRMPGLTPVYDALLRQSGPALLVVNYVDGLTQLNGLPEARFIVETHDLMFVNYRFQTGRSATDLRTVMKFRSEVALLDTAQAIVAISPVEGNVFRMMMDRTEILYIPDFGTEPPPPMVAPDAEGAAAYDLVFVGSENKLNVEGLVRFLRDHRAWLGLYRLAVCGNVCKSETVIAAVRNLPGVLLLGFVDDLGPVYRSAKAAVSPVSGTGMKIKILDALAHGKPVFASPSSCGGLPPGHEGCVFPIQVDVVRSVLDDEVALRNAEHRSRLYFASFSHCGDRGRLLDLIRDPGGRQGAVPTDDSMSRIEPRLGRAMPTRGEPSQNCRSA